MSLKSEMSSAEIERLLIEMSKGNTLDVELTDAEIDLALMVVPSGNRGEELSARALLKMQAAQRNREIRLPSFMLGKYLANARMSTGVPLLQVAEQTSVKHEDLESLESGVWSISQILQKFPANTMVRILATIKLGIEDFGDKLIELADKASVKTNQSGAFARSRQFSNTNSMRLTEAVTDYISELRELSF